MEFLINPSVYSSSFAFPIDVADKYLKLAKAEHIKVLLYIMRNNKQMPTIEEISKQTDVSQYDVKEALLFWADTGILISNNINVNIKSNNPKIIVKSLKPQREDVAKRGLEDPKIHYLLNETQLKFGRNLKTNESSTLVWLYDDLGLDVSLILLIVQYAVVHNKANIRFIESVATDWVNIGVESLADADEQLRILALSEQAWGLVSKAFGIERRKPSKKENEVSYKWINEWKISKELLEKAYEVCVDAKSKFIFSYTEKIIEKWYAKGYKNPDDIVVENKSRDEMQGVYDIDLYEKMVDMKD